MFGSNLPLAKPCWLSNYRPVFNVFPPVFQEDLFHDLIGHGSEGEWLLVPRNFPFTLSKNWCGTSHVPTTGDFFSGLWELLCYKQVIQGHIK